MVMGYDEGGASSASSPAATAGAAVAKSDATPSPPTGPHHDSNGDKVDDLHDLVVMSDAESPWIIN